MFIRSRHQFVLLYFSFEIRGRSGRLVLGKVVLDRPTIDTDTPLADTDGEYVAPLDQLVHPGARHGTVPQVEPLRATLPEGYPDLYQTVDIKVWPWVPVEEVAALYERARKELDATPNTSPRRLALFIFVMQQPNVHAHGEGENPSVESWRNLMDAWNEQVAKDEWSYNDVRNFRRDFNGAFDQIVNYYRSDTWFRGPEAGTEAGQYVDENDVDDPYAPETEFKW